MRNVASPHPQSITEGGPRAEFMLNKIVTAHAVSVVDLVGRALRKERVCIYNVMSVSFQWRQILKALTAANN